MAGAFEGFTNSFLQKPCPSALLVRTVRQCLDTRPGTGQIRHYGSASAPFTEGTRSAASPRQTGYRRPATFMDVHDIAIRLWDAGALGAIEIPRSINGSGLEAIWRPR